MCLSSNGADLISFPVDKIDNLRLHKEIKLNLSLQVLNNTREPPPQTSPYHEITSCYTASTDLGCLFPFIVATGCPYEQRPPPPPPKAVSFYVVQAQGYRTKLLRAPPGSLTCSVYSTVTRDLGLTSHPKDSNRLVDPVYNSIKLYIT